MLRGQGWEDTFKEMRLICVPWRGYTQLFCDNLLGLWENGRFELPEPVFCLEEILQNLHFPVDGHSFPATADKLIGRVPRSPGKGQRQYGLVAEDPDNYSDWESWVNRKALIIEP
jgi:hypothetical protein